MTSVDYEVGKMPLDESKVVGDMCGIILCLKFVEDICDCGVYDNI
jgi:hypothetical protein